jgi:phytoene dehydrogenase-like protein
VIVGGGHNGLVAAAYLARAGRSVLVLERRGMLGGASVSVEAFAGVPARLSRYAYLVSLLPELIVRELGLPLRLISRRVSSYTPDPRAEATRGLLVDRGDPAATAASFAALAGAGAHARWRALYELTGRLARAVFPTLTEPLRSRSAMYGLIGDEAASRALFEEPLGGLLARALGDELLEGVALTDGLIGTFAAAGEAGLRQNRCFLYHVIGRCSGDWLVPVGGMGALAGALERAARAAGAELLADAEVTAIEPERTGAGVRFELAGERGPAPAVRAGHVLGNLAPAELARLCGGREEELLGGCSDTGAGRPEGSQLKVNMVLARLPRLREAGLASERAFAGTFHANETAGQLQLAYEQAAGGRIPETVPCECYCHSLSDPSILSAGLREGGVHALTVFALHMPARLFRADNEGARARALAATLRSLDGVLGEPLEGCLLRGPDGELCVEARTPLDIEGELRMPGGHIFHRDLAWPFAERPEEVGSWGVETREPRVLLCGAGARRGGGVSGIPGRNAAMAVLGRR